MDPTLVPDELLGTILRLEGTAESILNKPLTEDIPVPGATIPAQIQLGTHNKATTITPSGVNRPLPVEVKRTKLDMWSPSTVVLL
jgi:hypothetical protein